MPRIPGNKHPLDTGGRAAERLGQFEQSRGLGLDPAVPVAGNPDEELLAKSTSKEPWPEHGDDEAKGSRHE